MAFLTKLLRVASAVLTMVKGLVSLMRALQPATA